MTACAVCGLPLAVGEFPCVYTIRPHGKAIARSGFEPRFMDSLGEHVTGWGDVRKHMREKKLEFRDPMGPGWHSARRDKIEERKKAARAEAAYGEVLHPQLVTVDGCVTVLYDAQERPLRRQIGFIV